METIAIPSIGIQNYNSFNMLSTMINHIGGGDLRVIICSYAITEYWARRLYKLKEIGVVSHICLMLDHNVIDRHREKIPFLNSFVDELFFCDSHAKLLIVERDSRCCVAVMSANATQNYRIESYYVTDNIEDGKKLKSDLSRILQGAHRG